MNQYTGKVSSSGAEQRERLDSRPHHSDPLAAVEAKLADDKDLILPEFRQKCRYYVHPPFIDYDAGAQLQVATSS